MVAAQLPTIAKTNKIANISEIPLSLIFYRFPFDIYSDIIGGIQSL
jgi:hypothetical protein